MLLGLDGSNNNGLPDFHRAARAGYRWALWKVSEGAYFTDRTWPVVRAEMQSAGIPHGGYHYAIAKNGDAAAQAHYFVERLAAQPWLLLPMIDVEEQGSEGVGNTALESFVYELGHTVRRELGVDRLILYADGNMIRNRGLDSHRLRDLYLLDYAYPGPDPKLPTGWHTIMWQFDWHGQVPGFSGPVDRDYLLPPYSLRELTIHAHTPAAPGPRPRRHNGPPPPLPHGA